MAANPNRAIKSNGATQSDVMGAVIAALSGAPPQGRTSKRRPGRPRKDGTKDAWMLYRQLMLVVLYHEAKGRGETSEQARNIAAKQLKEAHPEMRVNRGSVVEALAHLQPKHARQTATIVGRANPGDLELTDLAVELINEMAQSQGNSVPISRETIEKGTHLSFGLGTPPAHKSQRGRKKASRLVFGKQANK